MSSAKKTLNFDVHAYMMIHLGDQLISDDITAIAELVKNSYDADASLVDIIVNPNWSSLDNSIKGKIVIKDNGVGMSFAQVKKGWLTLGTSEKRTMKQLGQLTKKHNRYPLGDKGLGRLSAQRLGNQLTLITKQKGEERELKVFINWLDFLQDTNISNVKIVYEEKVVKKDEQCKSYTRLIITDLKEKDRWNETKRINQFEERLSKIITPFDFKRKFYVTAKVGERLLELPQIGKEILNSALSQYQFTVNKECIELIGKYRLEFFPDSDSLGDRLYEFASLSQNNLKKNNLTYLSEGRYVFEFKKSIPLISLGELNILYHPGCFSGYIYDFAFEASTYKKLTALGELKEFNKVSELSTYIKSYNGIKIFRDDFKIFPYGDLGNDWLSLGRRFTSGASYYFLRPQNVLGYIKLSGKDNQLLKEKTDREGLVEDEYSVQFFRICDCVIDEINKNRGTIRRKYSDYQKNISDCLEAKSDSIPSYVAAKDKIVKMVALTESYSQKSEISKQEIHSAKQMLKKAKNETLNLPSAEREKINTLFKQMEVSIDKLGKYASEIDHSIGILQDARSSAIALVRQIETTKNQLQEVMELAGFGLAAEMLTHELFTLINNTKVDIKAFLSYIRSNYDNDLKIEAFLESIISRVEALRKQVTHLAPGFRKVRDRKELLDMRTFISEHIAYNLDRAKRNGITIVYDSDPKDTFSVYTNKGLLMQIFDNLYSNSEYWLLHAYKNGLIKEKNYYISLLSTGTIIVWDSGIGVDKNLEDQIFEPFITSKPEGRGLGLYIISSIVQNWECSIRLMQLRNSFGNRFKFLINLSSIQQEGESV